jgi:hypothetical protein
MGDQPTFPREFAEVIGDVHVELGETIGNTNPAVAAGLVDYVQELIRGVDSPDEMVRYLASGMMCLFMAGREHALRGYPAPLPRVDQVGDGWVPNTVNDLFEGEDG